jgi:hypothetical protein
MAFINTLNGPLYGHDNLGQNLVFKHPKWLCGRTTGGAILYDRVVIFTEKSNFQPLTAVLFSNFNPQLEN